MINAAEKKKISLMKRRKRAILLSAVVLVLLAIALIFVLDYVETVTVSDADGTDYYIRKKSGSYALYDKDRNLIATESQYGYYVTAIGTLIEVNAETGEYKIIAILDTEGNEVQGVNTRLLMFPNISKENILSIDIYNSTGSFGFCRYNLETDKIDPQGNFIIKNHPMTFYDEEFFARMYVSAGYTLTLQKLTDPAPIKRDADGVICTHDGGCSCDYKEYGLAPEKRIDDEGNEYDYTPAYYVLTAIDGSRYKVLVGDMLVDGSGYYVQYVDMSGETEVKRDAVYVIDTDMGETMLAAVEEYVAPSLTYPMTSSTYFDVEDFTIGRRNDLSNEDEPYDNIISFTYIDLLERENTIEAYFPYEFNLDMEGYTPNSVSMESCLQKLNDPSYVKVHKLGPKAEDFLKYGLYMEANNEQGYLPYSPHTISFKYDIRDDSGNYVDTVHQVILISDQNENGNYYTYTIINTIEQKDGEEVYEFFYSYDAIVEVEGHTLNFLTWNSYDWINSDYINFDIAYIEKIQLKAPGYNTLFELDNSQSDISDEVNHNRLSVSASDSQGNQITTLGKMQVEDKYGYIWVISATELLVYNSMGVEQSMEKDIGYYAFNRFDRQALCRKGYIECADRRVEVNADTIYVDYYDDNKADETIVRGGTHLFLDYYLTLMYASIIDDYPLTAEEEAALISDPSKLVASIELTTRQADGSLETDVYSFYRISAHKAYITINGTGGFCVKMNRVNKFITDAQKFFNMELIDPTAKY